MVVHYVHQVATVDRELLHLLCVRRASIASLVFQNQSLALSGRMATVQDFGVLKHAPHAKQESIVTGLVSQLHVALAILVTIVWRVRTHLRLTPLVLRLSMVRQ